MTFGKKIKEVNYLLLLIQTDEYKNTVRAFGTEIQTYYDKNRHKKNLPESMKTHSNLIDSFQTPCII